MDDIYAWKIELRGWKSGWEAFELLIVDDKMYGSYAVGCSLQENCSTGR